MPEICIKYSPARGVGWNIDIIIGDLVVPTYTPLNHVVAQRVAQGTLDHLYKVRPEWRELPIVNEGLPAETEN
jgi:hypothetical protein